MTRWIVPTRVAARTGIAALALLLAVPLAGCGDPELSQVEPRDRKVLLIGIDGFDYETFEPLFKPLVNAGQLQKLSELRRRGLLVDLVGEQATLDPFSVGVDPAESWTTIATGFPPTKVGDIKQGHGVRDLTVPVEGSYGRAPVTTAHRLVPTVWDVLSASGVKSAVVNWPVTWPAEPLDGYLVSDRFFLSKFDVGAFGSQGRPDLPVVPPELKQAHDHLTWPPELAEPHAAAIASVVEAGAPPILATLKQLQMRARHAPTLLHLKQLEQAIRGDLLTKASLARLLATDPAIDFAACYLDSFDVACHLFWLCSDPSAWSRHADPTIRNKLPPNFADYAGIIPMTAILIDAMVRELCDAMGPDTTVILLTDHSLMPDAEPSNRILSLNPLLEQLGLLARRSDGAIDWARTRCFDRTPWESSIVRQLSINFVGECPEGSVPAVGAQERATLWNEIQNQLGGVKTSQPVKVHDESVRNTLFWEISMGEFDSRFVVYQTLPGDTKVELPRGTTTFNALFPPRPTSAKHTRANDPGMLLLSYPGATGDAYGLRGIPMGKGGVRSTHVAPLVLGLFGIPLPLAKEETTPTADYVWFMLDVPEAQEMALAPRVTSWESLVRFREPDSRLGAKRAENRRYVESLRYTFDTPATRDLTDAGPLGPDGKPEEDEVRDAADSDR